MSDMMDFPKTVEEFMEMYKMVDTDEVYSNGTEYVPIFRMKQWFEHQRTSNAHPTHECVEPTHECVEKQVTGKLIDVEIPTMRKSEETEKHERIFQEIVVEYPSISTYPEYEGKPYFSIKYVEDGRDYIGYGTYNPEVLSEYMKEYFIPSEPVGNSDTLRPKGKWIDYTDEGYVECPFCHSATNCDGNKDELHFCFSCGAVLKGETDD